MLINAYTGRYEASPKAPSNIHSNVPSVPSNCLDCAHHSVINDPDPDDWFCDDDMAVLCTKAVNPERNTASKYIVDRQIHRASAWSCRPYNLQKEAMTPVWCPLRAGSAT